LDDTTIIEKVGKTVAEKLQGLPPFEQAQLRRPMSGGVSPQMVPRPLNVPGMQNAWVRSWMGKMVCCGFQPKGVWS